MKQSERMRILYQCPLGHLGINQAQRQTAIEFAKWKDKNYVQHGDKYISPYFYFREVDINDPVHKHHLKTLDQLYEEWENGNGG